MLKKSLLALAVAGLSVNAFAADVNYTLGSPVSVNTIAKEVVTVATSTDLKTTDTISFPLQFSATNQNLVRIDLSNGAKFTADPSLVVAGGITATPAGLDASISEGGLGKGYVVFQLKGASTVAQDGKVDFTLNGITVANQGDLGARYRLYDNQVDAHNATTRTLADTNYAYATFANALVFTTDNTGVSKQINVSKSSKEFVNGTTTSAGFGSLTLNVKPNTYGSDLSGLPLSLYDAVGSDASVTVTGDFSAIAGNGSTTLLNGLAGSVNTAKTAVTFPLEVTGTTPNFVTTPLIAAQLKYAVDANNTGIAPSEFNAKLNLGTGAKLTAAPADVASFASLGKNGASAEVDLTMKPGGFYNDVVRITNKSGIAGDVFITVINDAGKSATINLADIAGQTSNVLAAGASTQQLPISDIFAAAEAKGLTLDGQGKLRLVVEAQIPEKTLSVQNWVVSTDGTTLSSF